MISKKNILAMALATSMVLPSNLAPLASIVAPITVFAEEDEEESAKTATIVLWNGSENEAFKKESDPITFTVKVANEKEVSVDEYKYFLPAGYHYTANPTEALEEKDNDGNFKLVVTKDDDSYNLNSAMGQNSSLYIQYQVDSKDYVQLTEGLAWDEGKVSADAANEALQRAGVYVENTLPSEIEKSDFTSVVPISYKGETDENPTIIGYRYDAGKVENCIDLNGAVATLKKQIVYKERTELAIPDLDKDIDVKLDEKTLSGLSADLEVVLPNTVTSTPIGKEITGKLGVKDNPSSPYKYKNAEQVIVKYIPVGDLADANTVVVSVEPTDPKKKIELQIDGAGEYIFDPSAVKISFADDAGRAITAVKNKDYEVEITPVYGPGKQAGKVKVRAKNGSTVFKKESTTQEQGGVDLYVNVNSNAIAVRLNSGDPTQKAFTVAQVKVLDPQVVKVIFGPSPLTRDEDYILSCKKGTSPIKLSEITQTGDYTLTIAGVEDQYFTGIKDIPFTVIPDDAKKIDLSSNSVNAMVDTTTKKCVLTKEENGKLILTPAPTVTVTMTDNGQEVTVDSRLYDFELDSYPTTVGDAGGNGKIVGSGKSVTKNGKNQVAVNSQDVTGFAVYGDLSSNLAEVIVPDKVEVKSDTPLRIAQKIVIWYNNKRIMSDYAVSYKDSTGKTLEDSEPFLAGTYTMEITPKDENSYWLNSEKLTLEIDENGYTTAEEVTPKNPSDDGPTGGGGGSTPSKPPKPDDPPTPVIGSPTPMYRLYNRLTGEHFFTTNKDERDSLLTSDTWQNEDQGWMAPTISDFPVYRLLNPNTTDHHYTTDQNEYDVLQSLGWVEEGSAFYSADKDNSENVQLHRLYNPNEKEAGSHHYTADEKERDALVAMGWKYEGLAWAGLPAEQ